MNYLLTVALLFGLLAAWLAVRAAAQHFAARHPEFGPPREEGEGCGGCGGGHCGGHCERSAH